MVTFQWLPEISTLQSFTIDEQSFVEARLDLVVINVVDVVSCPSDNFDNLNGPSSLNTKKGRATDISFFGRYS